MKKILLVISAIILIISILVSGGCVPCTIDLADIVDVHIWADNSSPQEYFLYVVSGERTTCEHFAVFTVEHASNTTIIVEIFNRECLTEGCAEEYTEVEHNIPLGSDFVVGVNYTVEVNDVTETFIPPIL